MAVADGGGVSGASHISKPRKPRRPTSVSPSPSVPKPSGIQASPYSPSGSPVGQQKASPKRRGTTRLSTLSLVSNLLGANPAQSQQQSSYMATLPDPTGNNVERFPTVSIRERPPTIAALGSKIAELNELSESELRKPEDTVTLDGIMNKMRRRISRRGGQGIYNPIMPVEGYQFSDNGPEGDFGPRTIGQGYHTGVDMSAPTGTPVMAAVGGRVISVSQDAGPYGQQIIVDHGNGETTMYAHLSGFNVRPGDKVKKGQVIGAVGSTGNSTGPHLHWETQLDGKPLPPYPLPDREIPQEILNEVAAKYLKRHPQVASQAAQGGQPQVSEDKVGPMAASAFGNFYADAAKSAGMNPSAPKNTSQAVNGEILNPQGQATAMNSRLDAFLQAIAEQESGGNYGAVGVPTRSGTALGKYQILDSNINGQGGWDLETLGYEITGQQFLNSPQLQDQIAKTKLTDYFNSYGPAGAAKAWYAGPGNADLNSDSPQYGGPSVNDYAASVENRMQKYLY